MADTPSTPVSAAPQGTAKERGNEAFRNKRYEEALALYTEAIAANPSSDKALYGNRSLTYFNLGKFDESAADSLKALELDPTFIKSYYRLGNVATRLGNLSEAVEHYKKAGSDDQAKAEVTKVQKLQKDLDAGLAYCTAKDWKQAVPLLRDVAKQATHSPAIVLPLCDALLKAGMMDEAVATLSSVIVTKHFASKLEAHYLLGLAYFDCAYFDETERQMDVLMGLPDGAYYKNAASVKSRASEVAQAIRNCATLVKGGNLEWAVESFTTAIGWEWLPNNARRVLHTHRAIVHMHMGEYEKARSDCNIALDGPFGSRGAPGHWFVSAYRCRGYCHEAMDEIARAIDDYERALECQPDAAGTKQRIEQLRELRPKRRDFYSVLNLKRSATARDIKLAYHRLAQNYHPDKAANDEERKQFTETMQRINEAYAVLSNEEKRQRYDAGESLDSIDAHEHDTDVYFEMMCGSVREDANVFQKSFHAVKKCAFFTTACTLLTVTCPCWCPYLTCCRPNLRSGPPDES